MSSNTAACTAIPKNIEDNYKQQNDRLTHACNSADTHTHINAVAEGKTQNRILYHEHQYS